MKDYNELKSILPGLQEDMPKPFYMIGELLDYGSFELCGKETLGIGVAYMIILLVIIFIGIGLVYLAIKNARRNKKTEGN